MKGCLKLPSPCPTPGVEGRTSFYSNPNSSTTSTSSTSSESHTAHKKSVAFGAEGTEEIYVADEWDRTPTEPARKLSYQDLLELREIQRSLPRAEQPYDLINSRRTRHYLSAVPIALVPLLAEDNSNVTNADLDDDVDEVCSSRSSSQTSSGATSPATGSPRSGSPTRWNSSTSNSSAAASSATSSYSPSPLAQTHYSWTDADVDDSDSTPASTTPAWSINFKRQSPASSTSSSRTPSPHSPLNRVQPPPTTTPTRSSPSPSNRTSPLQKPISHPHYMSSKAPGTSAYSPPAHLAHLVSTRAAPPRPKPSFAFLPLLDTPSPSLTESNSSSATPTHPAADAEGTRSESEVEGDETITISSPLSDAALLMASLSLSAIEPSLSSSSSDDAMHTDTEGDITSDTDMSSTYDPPTPSLTHASLDSSPPTSRASSCEPEFDEGAGLFKVPLPTPPSYSYKHAGQDSYFAPHEGQKHPHAPTHAQGHIFHNLPPLRSHIRAAAAGYGFRSTSGKLEAIPSPSLVPPSPLLLDEGMMEVRKKRVEKPQPKPKKKRSFIVVNDMEIELDGSEDEEEEQKVEEKPVDEGRDEEVHRGMDVAPAVGPFLGNKSEAEDTALSEPAQLVCPLTPPSKPIDVTKSSFSIPQPHAAQGATDPTADISSSLAPSLSIDVPTTPTPSAHALLAETDAGAGVGTLSTNDAAYMHPAASPDMDLHIPVRFKRTQV